MMAVRMITMQEEDTHEIRDDHPLKTLKSVPGNSEGVRGDVPCSDPSVDELYSSRILTSLPSTVRESLL